MGLGHSPRIVTENLVLLLDAANTKSVPKTNILTTWVDYGGNQTNYEVLGAYSVKLKNTTTGWVGHFPATVSSTGKYVITFTYYSDSDGSSLVLDNDGIMDNTYNTTLTVNITPQTYTGSVDVNTTGNIQHFFRRNGGGNIYVTNVSYFKLETTWTDLSGNGNTGTLVNGVGYNSSNLGSLSFDGVDDYVDCVLNSGLTGTGSWTMSAWFKINGAPSAGLYQNAIVDTDATGGSANMICTDWSGHHGGSQNQLLYASRPSTGGSYTNLLGPVLTQGIWYNATVVRNGTTDTKLYTNGSLSATYTGNIPTATQPLVRIGRWTDGTNYANCNISQVTIHSRALTAAEISQNYNALKSRFGL